MTVIIKSDDDYSNARVWVAQFDVVNSEMGTCLVQTSPSVRKPLPPEVYLRELKNLDVDDEDAVVSFQREYGLVCSCARAWHPYDARFAPHVDASVWDDKIAYQAKLGSLNATPILDERAAIEETARIARSMSIDNKILPTAGSLLDPETVEIELPDEPTVVSIAEAKACLNNAKSLCELFIGMVSDDGFEQKGTNHILARTTAPFLSSISGKFFKDVRVVDGLYGIEDFPTVPVLAGLYGQLLNGLKRGRAFKRCANPACDNMFQFGRGKFERKSKTYAQRRDGSDYCCEDCQRKAAEARRCHKKRAAKAKAAE